MLLLALFGAFGLSMDYERLATPAARNECATCA